MPTALRPEANSDGRMNLRQLWVPRGIQRNVTDKGVESTEYTLWTSVADTKNLKYYYRVHENPAIYELDLGDQDPTGVAVLIDNRPSNSPIVTVPAQFT